MTTLVHRAAEDGALDMLEIYAEIGCDLNSADPREGGEEGGGGTPLLRVIEADNPDALEILLCGGVDLQKTRGEGEGGEGRGRRRGSRRGRRRGSEEEEGKEEEEEEEEEFVGNCSGMVAAALCGSADCLHGLVTYSGESLMQALEGAVAEKQQQGEGEEEVMHRLLGPHGSVRQHPILVDMYNALYTAVREAQLECIRVFTECAAELQQQLEQHEEEDEDGGARDHKRLPRLLDLNQREPVTGRSVIHMAATAGDLECLVHLYENGASLDFQDESLSTPVHVAAALGHLDCLRYLLDHTHNDNATIDVYLKDADGHTALHNAAAAGNIGCVELLIAKGSDTIATDKKYRSPVHFATRSGNLDCLWALLESGADMDAKDHKENTPLHVAAARNRTECLRLLINSGADVHCKDDMGRTALHVAAIYGHVESLEMLIESGADLSSRDYRHVPVLQSAVKHRRFECVRLLLRQPDIDLEATDGPRGRTAVHVACAYGDVEGMKVLLQVERQQQYLMQKQRREQELIPVMGPAPVLRLPRLDVLMKDGLGPLHIVCRDGQVDLLRLLLENGAPVNMKTARDSLYGDRRGKRTPLQIAAASGHLDCVEVLVDYGEQQREGNGFNDEERAEFEREKASMGMNIKCNENSRVLDVRAKNDMHGNVLHAAAGGVCFDKIFESYKRKRRIEEDGVCGVLLSRVTFNDVMRPLSRIVHMRSRDGPGEREAWWKVPLETRDCEGRTPFLVACHQCNIDMMIFLFELGANCGAVDLKGNNALQILIMGFQGTDPMQVEIPEGNNDGIDEVNDQDDLMDEDAQGYLVANGGRRRSSRAEELLRERREREERYLQGVYHAITHTLEKHQWVLDYKALCTNKRASIQDEGSSAKSTEHGHTGPIEGREHVLAALSDSRFKLLLASRLLHDVGVDPNHRNKKEGLSALYMAVEKNLVSLVRFLISPDVGADVSVCDRDGGSLLNLACCHNLTECLQVLVMEGGVDIDHRDLNGVTPLHDAASRGHIECMQFLLSPQPTLTSLSIAFGPRPITSDGNPGVFNPAIKRVDVDCKDCKLAPILHFSAFYNQAEAIKLLLANGTSINTRDKQGRLAIHVACMQDSVDALQVLVEIGGCNVDVLDCFLANPIIRRGSTPQSTVSRISPTRSPKQTSSNVLPATGVNAASGVLSSIAIAAAVSASMTSAQVAPRSSSQPIGSGGRRVSNCRVFNKAPIHYAVRFDAMRCLRLLVDRYAADINRVDAKGNTPLHYACCDVRLEQLLFLLRHGARVDVRNVNGKRPVDLDLTRKRRRSRGGSGAVVLPNDEAHGDMAHDTCYNKSLSTTDQAMHVVNHVGTARPPSSSTSASSLMKSTSVENPTLNPDHLNVAVLEELEDESTLMRIRREEAVAKGREEAGQWKDIIENFNVTNCNAPEGPATTSKYL
eukprot:Nk52_evm1s765 gene=Nk52_evmTU1s765